jgi:ABC-type multidrug transport system fused ATPase/permease subunit
MPKAELMSRATNDVDGIEQIYNWSYFKLLNSVIGGLGGVAVIMVLDYRLALIVIAIGTASVYISSCYSKKIERIGKQKHETLAKSSTDAYELIKASKTIRLLNLKDSITKQFDKSIKEEAKIKVTSGVVTSRMKAISIALSSVSYIVTLLIGAIFVYFKLSDWGTVVAITGLKYLTDDLFVEAGGFLALMQQNIACAKRVFEVLDMPIETINDSDSFSIDDISYPVELNNVSFGYNESNVIDNLSISIEDNKLTILVGESGCGKSTLMKLLLGLYSIKGGNITFRGNEDVSLQSLRKKTAYVPQDLTLFGGSVLENIAYGNEKASQQEIINASRKAGAHEFIVNFADGYDTVLYDDGVNLSGGQKQRILIARALLKNSDVLLLDEITSALDDATEGKIMSTIKEISRSKAVVFITHKEKVAGWGDVVYKLGL